MSQRDPLQVGALPVMPMEPVSREAHRVLCAAVDDKNRMHVDEEFARLPDIRQ